MMSNGLSSSSYILLIWEEEEEEEKEDEDEGEGEVVLVELLAYGDRWLLYVCYWC